VFTTPWESVAVSVEFTDTTGFSISSTTGLGFTNYFLEDEARYSEHAAIDLKARSGRSCTVIGEKFLSQSNTVI
jgi:hypothetical protein